MQTELLPDFLHLYHSFGTRSAALLRLLQHFDADPTVIRKSSPAALRGIGLAPKAIARARQRHDRQVKADLAWAQADNNHLLCYDDDSYPALLRQIPDFPVLLYASGDIELLRAPQIAIVGSRLCTPGGARTAFDFAAQLAAAGLVVTSGMALGIDGEAHSGALQAGGRTLAVTATGIDLVYPGRHHKLAAQIRQQGLIVSEFPLGTSAQRPNFPQRNRIISGLALGVLVVEAAQRSGSLITARLAAEQGREVFAIPGSIHNPQTRGCHDLIRDGATLVEGPGDITRELTQLASFVIGENCEVASVDSIEVDPAHRRLLDSIGYDPVNCDILVRRSGLTIDQLSSMLLVLELNDLIQSAPGGCFVRI
ncbi:MAG: DNA-processing protein DprA [Gammaproteobacteria bacterium]